MDELEGFLLTVMVIAVIVFIGAQGTLCIAMPQEWFCGLVSGLVFAACLWLKRKL